MPLIVPLISCFYANQTFLGLDGRVNNTPSRPRCRRRASSWRQLVPTDGYRRAQRPGLGSCPPGHRAPGAAPGPLFPFHRGGN